MKLISATIKHQLCNNALPGNCVYSFATVTFVGNCNSPRLINTVNKKSTLKTHLNVAIYPNPNIGIFYIDFEKEITSKTTIEIYNMIGQQLYNVEVIDGKNVPLDISNYPNGNYLIKIINKNQTITKK